MGIEERYDLALGLIVFAALLDGIDGRIARLLKASSRFGAELDSLADFVNFGVAPALLIFNWGLGSLKSLGWICVMIFALASALRLARFNVAIEDDQQPKWRKEFFMGMPTPAAAIIVLLPVYLESLGFGGIRSSPLLLNVVLVYTLLVAFMMVRLHDGVDDPHVFRKAPGRAHCARVRDADLYAGHRLRVVARHVSIWNADGGVTCLPGLDPRELVSLRPDGGQAPGKIAGRARGRSARRQCKRRWAYRCYSFRR
jgi:CDP-diacylglycerol--serine O-phosphatidyltransferase